MTSRLRRKISKKNRKISEKEIGVRENGDVRNSEIFHWYAIHPLRRTIYNIFFRCGVRESREKKGCYQEN